MIATTCQRCACEPATTTWTPPVGTSEAPRVADVAWWYWRACGTACEDGRLRHHGPREAPRHLCEACFLVEVQARAAREGVRCHGYYKPEPRTKIGGRPWARRLPERQAAEVRARFADPDPGAPMTIHRTWAAA